MTFKNIVIAITITTFAFLSCKTATKNETVVKQQVSLAISGMTCEIGCAKTIQAKLAKKEGVLAAKVIFVDSVATIEYDENTTSKKDLIAFVSGIAGGNLYKAKELISIEASKEAAITKEHTCTDACKEKCATKADKKECNEDCKMACCKA